MRESIPNFNNNSTEEDSLSYNRRELLRGAIAAIGAGALLVPYRKDSIGEKRDPTNTSSGTSEPEIYTKKVESTEQTIEISRKFKLEVEKNKKYLLRANTASGLLKQFDPDEEVRLVEKIQNGEVRTTIEVSKYFGGKPVVGAEHLIRIDYVSQEMEFKNFVPEKTQDELRLIMPGLCAQESRFNNNAKSKDGAEGIFQFMPDTWQELRIECKKEDDKKEVNNDYTLNILSLKDQVRAAGKHFSNIYRRLYHYAGMELNHIEKVFFPKGGFEKYFLVPLIINSYNAGGKRISDAVMEFSSFFPDSIAIENEFKLEVSQLGYDVFHTLSLFAVESKIKTLKRYDKDSSEYFSKVFANNELLK